MSVSDFEPRTAAVERTTAETDVTVELSLDGDGTYDINTGVGFYDHMLDLFTKHGGFNLTVRCDGDLHVDDHHTVEDVAITLGQAVRKALGDKAHIARFGHAYVPMDEALVRSVIDLSGRPFFRLDGSFDRDGVGDVLVADTRETMLARPDVPPWEGASQYYGMGWFVTETGEEPLLWHNGSLPGSYGFLAHFSGEDLTLAALLNGRSADSQFRRFNVRAQGMLLGAVGSVSSWPERDLFGEFE
jgi:imidazoleglycerol phosphate dehydratase HisB